jgi:hypothetical protein
MHQPGGGIRPPGVVVGGRRQQRGVGVGQQRGEEMWGRGRNGAEGA